MPFAPTLHGYRAEWLAPDLIAGLTLVAIAVPEQIATARLANMPAIAGLYAFIAGSVVFAVLGRNRQMSVGADSTVAPIFAAGVAGVAAAGTPQYAHLVSVVALLVGAMVIAVGLFKLGWIAQLLSTPVITGVLAGIAVEIAVRQLPAVLGLPGESGTTIDRLRAVAHHIGRTNGWAVVIAGGVLGLIVVFEKVDRRIPAALIGVAAATGAVATAGLKAHGVQVLGTIKGGLPSVALPHAGWGELTSLLTPAITVAFVCVAQTAATVRASSSGPGAMIEFNQDLVAVGAGSVAAAFGGSFAVNSSPPRTAVVTAAGGRSQLAGLVAAGGVLGVALFATSLLRDLPQAALGAILLFVATRLFRIGDLRSILSFSRVEFALAVVTGGVLAFVGIEQGIGLAIVLSLAERIRQSARPRDVLLGRVPGTDHWIPTDIGRPTEQIPGVVVYMLYAALWYGDADFVRTRITRFIGEADAPLQMLVLDANGISDIDFTGARALGDIARQVEAQGATISIARASHLVHHDLKHSGLLDQIGPEHLYVSVADAIAALPRPG